MPISEERRAELTQQFQTIDTNGDGDISREEVHAYFTAQGVANVEQAVEEMFQKYDANGDGVISLEEYIAANSEWMRTSNRQST